MFATYVAECERILHAHQPLPLSHLTQLKSRSQKYHYLRHLAQPQIFLKSSHMTKAGSPLRQSQRRNVETLTFFRR